jgi:hypothetical protein
MAVGLRPARALQAQLPGLRALPQRPALPSRAQVLPAAAARRPGTGPGRHRPARLGQSPAHPRDDEITQLRELIRRIKADLSELTAHDQALIHDAVRDPQDPPARRPRHPRRPPSRGITGHRPYVPCTRARDVFGHQPAPSHIALRDRLPTSSGRASPPFCAGGRPSLEQPPGLPNWAIGALVRARVRFDPMLLGLGGVSAWIGLLMVARFRQRLGARDGEVDGYMPGPR